MNKQELVKHLAETADVSRAKAESLLNALVETITTVVASGNDISISDLGKFSAKEHAARIGRNPATGESIDIPAKTSPKFSPAKAFKDAVAG